MNKIIDTNVPVIANGNKSKQASEECHRLCIHLLNDLMEHEKFKLVIDLQWIVLGEYKNNLAPLVGTRVGNQFLKWVLQNHKTYRCILVQITQQDDSFVEFPNHDERLNRFDPADRKWIAVALAHKRDYDEVPAITQAADMKWKQFEAPFSDHGIKIDFICDPES